MIQLNIHETDLSNQYLSHHLTWHCSSIYEDLHGFVAYERKNCLEIINKSNAECFDGIKSQNKQLMWRFAIVTKCEF